MDDLHPLAPRESIGTHESHADSEARQRLRERERGCRVLRLLAQHDHVVVLRKRVRQTTHRSHDFSLTLHRLYRLVAAVDRSHCMADERCRRIGLPTYADTDCVSIGVVPKPALKLRRPSSSGRTPPR